MHDSRENILLTAHDLNGCFVGILIELLGELIAAVVVKVGRVDIKDKLTVVGGIRLQAARGDGSIGFQLGEQVGVAGGWLFEVDVPCSALGDDVGVPVAVLFALVLLFLEPFAYLLGADEITLDYVKQYILGIAPFSVCYLVSYNLEVLVKTDGYPRYALFTVIGGCLTNCVLDYIAIFHLDMGVFGAAVATGISQLVTCISYFVHFFSTKCTFRLCKFRFDPHLYARILPIGLSDGVTELCTGLMIFLFNRTVLKCIGTDGVVTYTVIAYVTTIVINLMVGISQGSQPLVSFQYGRGDRAACRKLLHYALTTVCIFAPALFLLVFFFAPQIVRAYLSHATQELIAYSIQAFRKYSISYLLLGFNIVIGGFMTAIERPVPAICISVGRGLALQSAVLLLLAAIFGGDAVWYTPIFSEALCLVMSLLFLRSYRRQTDMQA